MRRFGQHYAQLKRLAMKHLKPSGRTTLPQQQQYSTRKDHAGSRSRQPAQSALQRRIAILRQQIHYYSRPVSPLKIISTPSTAITAANTIRTDLTRARVSTRAPANDPASTPSVTGIAIAGLI